MLSNQLYTTLRRKQIVESRLEDRFPLFFTAIYAVCLVLIGLVGIVCQSWFTSVRAELFQSGSGYWGALACFLCSAFSFSLYKCRTYAMYMTSIAIQSVLQAIIYIGYVILNIKGIMMKSNDQEICESTTTTPFDYIICIKQKGQVNTITFSLHILMVCSGTISIILALAYFILLNNRTSGSCFLSSKDRTVLHDEYNEIDDTEDEEKNARESIYPASCKLSVLKGTEVSV